MAHSRVWERTCLLVIVVHLVMKQSKGRPTLNLQTDFYCCLLQLLQAQPVFFFNFPFHQFTAPTGLTAMGMNSIEQSYYNAILGCPAARTINITNSVGRAFKLNS